MCIIINAVFTQKAAFENDLFYLKYSLFALKVKLISYIFKVYYSSIFWKCAKIDLQGCFDFHSTEVMSVLIFNS